MSKLIDNIILRSDIPDYLTERGVQIKRTAYGYRCKCPIHDDAKRDDAFSFDGKKWYCFESCQGGTIIELHKELENVTYMRAVEELAEMYGIDLANNQEYINAKNYYTEQEKRVLAFKKNLGKAKEYLTNKRNLSEETIDNLGYGYDSNRGCITIPIKNINGMYVAMAVRNFRSGVPKYVNDNNNDYYGKGDMFYNFDNARKLMRKQERIYVCEGYFDVASAFDEGLPCVGYTGSSVTVSQVKLLSKELQEFDKKFTVMLAPDNDDAGKKNIPQMRDKFKRFGPNLNVRVVKIPDGYKDFSDLHVAGISIADLQTEHIDVYCCMEAVKECKDLETQYQVAIDFLSTVSNKLIRSEIAERLAKLWGKEAKDIIGIANGDKTETSMVKDFKTPLQCVNEFRDLMSNGTIGTGFSDLDQSVGKFFKSEVVVVAAYSGVGKTFAAIQIALHAAFREKKNVIFFSMEMSAATLITRLIAMFMRKTEEEVRVLLQQGDEIAVKTQSALNKKLLIVDQNSLTIKDIRTYVNLANAMVFENGQTDMIVVDYLQYMPGTSEYTVMSETVRSFKPLAKELNLIPIVLSQLNREGRPWDKPNLAQMKGGGDIEATADWILGMWRDGENPTLSLEEQDARKDDVNLAILKGRRRCGQRDFKYIFDAKETNYRQA